MPEAKPDPTPPANGGLNIVATFGIATLLLAALLTLAGCSSAVAAVYYFIAAASLQSEGQKTINQAGNSESSPVGVIMAPTLCCAGGMQEVMGAMVALLATILSVMAAATLLLAGGHWAVVFGIRRRRPWVPVMTMVVATFTGLYGLTSWFLTAGVLLQSNSPDQSQVMGMVFSALVGVVFVGYAVYAWIVMLHPACVPQFRPPQLQD